ncbi:KAP family P-loop domain protein [Acinetobacter sp. A3.8]|uniref:KAP family P-loop domain protein n=1 Tax=Acinetobacter sedimenti TaxID=2919922 RepID=A0A9X1WVK4_9GAMM|nr:P-loop NTPase fold protein [Acinetobacter sedimenti]MCJ8145413.1 KAP family P-loop domain protein [Acinetobacter sedimenti]
MISPQKRLEDIFNANANNGLAIAITGQWGIGKTFTWEQFLESQRTKERLGDAQSNISTKKYAYISLFGIESLTDLKTQIYSNIENHHLSVDVPKWLKGLPAIFKDSRITQYGISAPVKLIDNLMFNQVKDAIICFDDFERMSDKMNIKDVMGLANFLKQERNCQVVLILDESKTNEENKNSYAEYKEKLVDETIKITTVEPLLRDKAKDLDQELIELLVKFSNALDIHNFRFFQKVLKLYRQFLEKLPLPATFTSKKMILVRVLQGYLIEDFGKDLNIQWHDFTREKWIEVSDEDVGTGISPLYQKLGVISSKFTVHDLWFEEFRKWFTQSAPLNESTLIELAQSSAITENQVKVRAELIELQRTCQNMNTQHDFCKKLYDCSINSIGFENLNTLHFCSKILSTFKRKDLARLLNKSVKIWIDQSITEKGKAFADETFHYGFEAKNPFYRYIRIKESLNPYLGLPPLIDVIDSYVLRGGWNSETDGLVLEKATLNDWFQLLFEEIDQNERFKDTNKLRIIGKILKQKIKPELNPQIKELIYQALDRKAQESEIMQLNVKYIKQRLDEDS